MSTGGIFYDYGPASAFIPADARPSNIIIKERGTTLGRGNAVWGLTSGRFSFPTEKRRIYSVVHRFIYSHYSNFHYSKMAVTCWLASFFKTENKMITLWQLSWLRIVQIAMFLVSICLLYRQKNYKDQKSFRSMRLFVRLE